MNKKQSRQNKITSFMEGKAEVSLSDILSFLSVDIDRKTLQRDLKELEEKFLIYKKGTGKSTVYSLSESFKILEEVDIEKYFETPYLKREIVKNFSKYDSQTLINKEFERIMIEFSWKSSAIEGNTYSLLGTEALIKNNVIGKGKTKEETQMILNHKDAFNEAIQNRERFIKLRSA